MIQVLRNYNANALKQAIRTAEEMANKCGSEFVKDAIREMIILSDNLEKEIQFQEANGLEETNRRYFEYQDKLND